MWPLGWWEAERGLRNIRNVLLNKRQVTTSSTLLSHNRPVGTFDRSPIKDLKGLTADEQGVTTSAVSLIVVATPNTSKSTITLMTLGGEVLGNFRGNICVKGQQSQIGKVGY